MFAGLRVVFAGLRVEGAGPLVVGAGPLVVGTGPLVVGGGLHLPCAGPHLPCAGPLVVGGGFGAALVVLSGSLSPWELRAVEDADVNPPIALHKASSNNKSHKRIAWRNLRARVISGPG